MQPFHYQNDELYLEDVNLTDVANQIGTPCYVYSKALIESNWNEFESSAKTHSHRICYAVKANSNIAILQLLARLNAGFDIVSGGELERVITAGGKPSNIVFSGVGKNAHEIRRALQLGIHCFNVESESELFQIQTIAEQEKKIACVTLRINPNVDALTHPYIATGLTENKFGIQVNEAIDLALKIQSQPYLQLIGIGCHIGSQLTELSPLSDAIDCLLSLVAQLSDKDITLEHINIGGGLGVNYHDENPPTISEYVTLICKKLKNSTLEIIFEPGRAMIANAGVLLTTVEYLKANSHCNFAIVDAAMNDLIRPALYAAWHNILPLTVRNNLPQKTYDVVGPVCESADFLGKNRSLAIQPGDRLAICSTGAYGFCMSSNYNSRPRAAEILIDDKKIHIIRNRETLEQLYENEKLIN